jgi:hypothetical protein
MRNNLRTLVLGGALLASASLAKAQTTLLDSLSAGKNLNLGAGAGAVVGYDAGATATNGPSNPSTDITQSGYVALPFTITDGNSYNLTSVAIEAAYLKAKDPNFAINGAGASLWGAIVSTSSVTSGSLNGATAIGGFFQLTQNAGTAGDTKNHIFNGTFNANTLVQAGQSYFLVLAPEAKFGTQTGDKPVLEFGSVNGYSQANLPTGGNITGTAATESALLSEKMGANSGDSLSQPTLTGQPAPVYGAVRLIGLAAAVPETSTVLTALLGLAPVGGLLLRRRRAN